MRKCSNNRLIQRSIIIKKQENGQYGQIFGVDHLAHFISKGGFFMAKTKTTGFFFKMSQDESELFEQRMALTGIKNKSAFIRKMCIDGHVFNLDLGTLNEISRLLRITANNVNQIARRVNSGGEIYGNELTEVNNQLTTIRSDFGNLLTALSEVANAKPGKRFIPPPTIRDIREYAEQSAAAKEAAEWA